MAAPYEVHKVLKITKDDLKSKVPLKLLDELPDDSTEYYVSTQYKNTEAWYMNTNNEEVYISFHAWLYKKSVGDIIEFSKKYYTYNVDVGIFPLIGDLKPSKHYPKRYHFSKNRKEILESESGISFNELCQRRLSIHTVGNLMKFSPFDSFNFSIEDDNVVFLSIIRSIFGNCVTLHIFRNVCDNDFKNSEFDDLIKNFV